MSMHARAARPAMRVVLPALALLLIVSIVASAAFGPAPIAMPAAVRIVATHIVSAFGEAGAVAAGAGDDSIVWLIRMPRALLAALVGATLAAVGVALQAATANRRSAPARRERGAMLGAVAVTVMAGAAFGPFTLSAAAFAGALAATACVVALAYRRGRLESDRLLLAGVSVSFMMAAFGNLLLYLGDQRAASSVLFWMLGGVGLARWDLLPVPAVCAALAGGALYARRRELNALMSGDVAAAALGVPSARLRREVFVVASFATGAMVAVSGAIGFVEP